MTTLTASEAAAALGCSRRWLRELATRGVLCVSVRGGGRGRQTEYSLAEFGDQSMREAWLDGCAKKREAAK